MAYRERLALKQEVLTIECQPACAPCCNAPSLSSPIPRMPEGKPAGVRCVQLTANNRCAIYGRPERPKVCAALRASEEMCGHSAEEALRYLAELEHLTRPDPPAATGLAAAPEP